MDPNRSKIRPAEKQVQFWIRSGPVPKSVLGKQKARPVRFSYWIHLEPVPSKHSLRLPVVSNFGDSGEIHAHTRKWVPARRHATRRGVENQRLQTNPGTLNLLRTFHVQNSDWLYLGFLSTIHKLLSTLSIKLIQFKLRWKTFHSQALIPPSDHI